MGRKKWAGEIRRFCDDDRWHGGEDYELLLTIPQDKVGTALETARQIRVCLSSIGEMGGAAGAVVVDGLPDADRKPGHDHFT